MNKTLTFLMLVSMILASCKLSSKHKQTRTGMITETNTSTKSTTLAAVERFNEAFNRHDVDAVMNAMTEDCIFENTNPAPDGTRLVGAEAVRAYWTKFFTNNPDAFFEAEDIFADGDRCVVRWIYRKTKDGKPWHLRGVDVFKVRNGKVAEKLAYVKG
ncbi:nuclear transport factor 2 family protein [Emticicia fontis]